MAFSISENLSLQVCATERLNNKDENAYIVSVKSTYIHNTHTYTCAHTHTCTHAHTRTLAKGVRGEMRQLS